MIRLLILAACLVPSAAQAADSLSVFPLSLRLNGADDAPQLAVTWNQTSRLVDVTAAVEYLPEKPGIVTVHKDGRVFPLANGSTAILIRASNGETLKVPVSVQGMQAPRPLNFANQIEPILTKLSCNSGGCHGKIAGQNGFRLSLLGFDPEFDYMTLVKESRGRRLMPSAPDQSLFLQKAAGIVPHGGGKKTEVGSEEYKILRRWIASGLPYGTPSDPIIQKVTVYPESRVLDQASRQQLVVIAHYSDGSQEDVTRRAQYESNETDVATVSESGLIQTLHRTGQAAVMVRFSGVVTVFQAIVPRPGPAPAFTFEPKTLVDQHTSRKWRELGIAPSELASDEQFIRRAYLDMTGTLPSISALQTFLADQRPDKRDRLIDELLETPEYAYLFANKWADVLRVKRRNSPDRATGTYSFHNWIKDSIAQDKPFDQFAREILTAVGDETTSPPTVWYKEVTTPEQFVDDVSQVFLGQRLACANCHHHPYEKWSQDDYWGIAAFFGRVGKKEIPQLGRQVQNQNRSQFVFTRSSGTVTNKRTNRIAELKPLDAPVTRVGNENDPRVLLADWMTAPSNPFFARAVANRYWAHFFGRGIVDPLDDMRVTNPPSNPALLDALAQNLIDNRFRLKDLIRTICKSRTYQLSSTPNEWNQSDRQSYARYYPRRLSAEVVFDAVCQITDSPSDFPGLPKDRFAPARALQLPDEAFQSYFLDVLGRPQRISACECERVNEASLAMTLHLLNSQEVQDKLSRVGGRADKLARDTRPDSDKIRELFLLGMGKWPTEAQLQLALEHLAKNEKSKKQAYENLIWAMLNSKAFLFNQ